MSAEGPYLIVETDANRCFPLQDPTTLGRSSENSLPLEDPGCSGRHAVIRPDKDRWLLEDLGSTNGTWVNGEQLHQPRPLQEGDRIQVGAQILRVGGLGRTCGKCGQAVPATAIFCPGCGVPLKSSGPSPTVVMAPPALAPKVPGPPPVPPAVPPPVPIPMPPPIPAMPSSPARKKKGGCWLSCCLVSLVLLIPLALAGAVQPLLVGQAIAVLRGEPVSPWLSALPQAQALRLLVVLLLVQTFI